MKPDMMFPNNPSYEGMASIMDELTFTCEGHSQHITLIMPNYDPEGDAGPFPLLVFLQGSGWTSPNRNYQIPQLGTYAQRGLAVASITHRNATQGHPFPAFLKDTKAAIRFLRSQAQALRLDPERVAFFGTSSGGNTALLVGLTGDDPRYQTGDYAGYSDAVRAVVECFGPSDLLDYEGNELSSFMKPGARLDNATLTRMAEEEDSDLLRIMLSLIGDQDPISVLRAMSPLYEVKDQATYPPFLLLQGDMDPIVPLSQCVKIHERLRQAGARSTYALIKGAEHEGTFWSAPVHQTIFDFLMRHLAD